MNELTFDRNMEVGTFKQTFDLITKLPQFALEKIYQLALNALNYKMIRKLINKDTNEYRRGNTLATLENVLTSKSFLERILSFSVEDFEWHLFGASYKCLLQIARPRKRTILMICNYYEMIGMDLDHRVFTKIRKALALLQEMRIIPNKRFYTFTIRIEYEHMMRYGGSTEVDTSMDLKIHIIAIDCNLLYYVDKEYSHSPEMNISRLVENRQCVYQCICPAFIRDHGCSNVLHLQNLFDILIKLAEESKAVPKPWRHT